MTCDHLRRLLALLSFACAMRVASGVPGAPDFQSKVSFVLEKEPETPKCFTDSNKDFTCFWEEDEERAGSADQYSFTYAYRKENSSKCPLTVHSQGEKKLFICHLNQASMFELMDIQIHREGRLIHNRSLLVELFFLLDPLANVSVSAMGQQGQLNVSWIPPPLRHMDDSLMYEVSYAMTGSREVQVEVVRASSRVILRGLQPGTKYKVRVRTKLDGISYNGFWSMWSDPVFVETAPAEFNLLIVFLILTMAFIVMVLSFTVLVSNRRFLRRTIWPTIPTPESKFQGLFTDHGGDFQEWLKHTNGGLWSSPASFYNEEYPTFLEVLSELNPDPPYHPPPLPPKMSGAPTLRHAEEDVYLALRKMPHNHWLLENFRVQNQHPLPCSQYSPLESQDTYVTGNNHGQVARTREASLPIEALLALKKTMLSEVR